MCVYIYIYIYNNRDIGPAVRVCQWPGRPGLYIYIYIYIYIYMYTYIKTSSA